MRRALLAAQYAAGLGLAVSLGAASNAPATHWMGGMWAGGSRGVDAGLPAGCEATLLHVDRSDVVLDELAGRFLVEGRPFTGVAELHDDAGTLRQRERFIGGRRHGLYEKFDASGTLRSRTPYRDGRIHGLVQTWWATGQRRAAAMVLDGVAQGRQPAEAT